MSSKTGPAKPDEICGVFRHRGVQFHKARYNAAQGRRGADILVEQTPTPYGMALKDYPKTIRLLKRSNQSLQPTAGRRDACT